MLCHLYHDRGRTLLECEQARKGMKKTKTFSNRSLGIGSQSVCFSWINSPFGASEAGHVQAHQRKTCRCELALSDGRPRLFMIELIPQLFPMGAESLVAIIILKPSHRALGYWFCSLNTAG